MAEIIWAETALADIDAISEYISLAVPAAAERLVQKIFDNTDRLANHPEPGSTLPELKELGYREILIDPVSVIYKIDNEVVYIIHVAQQERLARNFLIQEEKATYTI